MSKTRVLDKRAIETFKNNNDNNSRQKIEL